MQTRLRRFCAVLLIVPLVSGCTVITAFFVSVSGSMSSISSISDSLKSISESSSGDDESASAYPADVELFAREVATRPELEAGFVRGIGHIAERHGISHWEAHPETLRAIGAGLREAGLREEQIEPFLARVGRDTGSDRALVLEGYRQASL